MGAPNVSTDCVSPLTITATHDKLIRGSKAYNDGGGLPLGDNLFVSTVFCTEAVRVGFQGFFITGKIMKYLHFGVPTTDEKNWVGHIAELGVHVTDPVADPFGIEWLKFDSNSPMHEAIRTKPHAAFQVGDLDATVAGKTILLAPMSPMPGLRIAFIEHEGAVIELSQTE